MGAFSWIGVAASKGFDTAFACAIGTGLVFEWPEDVTDGPNNLSNAKSSKDDKGLMLHLVLELRR